MVRSRIEWNNCNKLTYSIYLWAYAAIWREIGTKNSATVQCRLWKIANSKQLDIVKLLVNNECLLLHLYFVCSSDWLLSLLSCFRWGRYCPCIHRIDDVPYCSDGLALRFSWCRIGSLCRVDVVSGFTNIFPRRQTYHHQPLLSSSPEGKTEDGRGNCPRSPLAACSMTGFTRKPQAPSGDF